MTDRPEQVTGNADRAEDLRCPSSFAKRCPPSFLRAKILALENIVKQRLYRSSHLELWLRDMRGQSFLADSGEDARLTYQRALIDWLRRAQDAVPGGGVAGYYALADGWSPAYPETTGYIIVTCLDAAKRLKDPDLTIRARRMADWELNVQLPDGSWQSGFVTTPRIPAVFNTGQVIQGLVSAYVELMDNQYLEAAIRGGHWLVDNQDEDGAWRRYTYKNFPNTYATRVAWPLLALDQVTGERTFRRAAVRYLEWASQRQDETGWFDRCTLEPGDPALTHTLGYTIEGFIESGVLLGDDRWIAVGQRSADALLHRFEIRRHMAGTYDRGWRGDYSFSCLTGCAQISRVWGRLFDLTKDARYLNAMLKLDDYVLGRIDLMSHDHGIRGGVTGSHPVWGDYMSYRLPSWAVKFTLDALFQEDDAMARLMENSFEHQRLVRLSR